MKKKIFAYAIVMLLCLIVWILMVQTCRGELLEYRSGVRDNTGAVTSISTVSGYFSSFKKKSYE